MRPWIALAAALPLLGCGSSMFEPKLGPPTAITCDQIRDYSPTEEAKLADAFSALKKLPDSATLKPLTWVVDEDHDLRQRARACLPKH